MKRTLILLSLTLFCAISFAQSKPKIAVYVANSDLSEAEKKVLSTKILTPFVQSGEFRAIERSDAFLSGMARERQKQRDGSVDDSQISRLGKEAGVQFVCVADLVDAFGIYSVSARLIDTETAEIVGIGETEMKGLNEIGEAADKIFEQISGLTGDSNYETTEASATPNSFTDTRDKKKYRIKRIGDYTWFLQDLSYKKNKYIWKEALKACPAGWRLPDDGEWKMLRGDAKPNDIKEFSKYSKGFWWSSTKGKGTQANGWNITNGSLKGYGNGNTSNAYAVRCIKD